MLTPEYLQRFNDFLAYYAKLHACAPPASAMHRNNARDAYRASRGFLERLPLQHLHTVLEAATRGRAIPFASRPAQGCPIPYASSPAAAMRGPQAPDFALRDNAGTVQMTATGAGTPPPKIYLPLVTHSFP